MAGLAVQHLPDVRHRAHRVFEQEEHVRAPIPGFGPIGVEREDAVEELDGERVFLGLDGLRRPRHQHVRRVGPGPRPAPLDERGDTLALALVLSLGEALEEVVHGGRPGLRPGLLGGRRRTLRDGRHRGGERKHEDGREKTHAGII